MEKKENKNAELIKKIDELTKKIEEAINDCSKEEKMLKRYQYVVKCKMLMVDIERYKKLKIVRKYYDKQKEKNGITRRDEKRCVRSKIIEINNNIKQLEFTIRQNSEYDIESSKFIFPKEDIKRSGGVLEYTKELKDSKIEEQVKAANKISENIVKRAEIKRLERQLKQQKEFLKKINKNERVQGMRTSMKEIALEVEYSELNIFHKIGNFVNNTIYEIKEFVGELADDIKSYGDKVKRTSEYRELYAEYTKQLEDIDREYLKKKEELGEKYTKLNEYNKKSYAEYTKQLKDMDIEHLEKKRELGERYTKFNKNNKKLYEEKQNIKHIQVNTLEREFKRISKEDKVIKEDENSKLEKEKQRQENMNGLVEVVRSRLRERGVGLEESQYISSENLEEKDKDVEKLGKQNEDKYQNFSSQYEADQCVKDNINKLINKYIKLYEEGSSEYSESQLIDKSEGLQHEN